MKYNEWKIHPKWNEIYHVTDKGTGLRYQCVIIWRSGETKVLIKLTHSSTVIPFQEGKERYKIQRYNFDESPKDFLTDHIGVLN